MIAVLPASTVLTFPTAAAMSERLAPGSQWIVWGGATAALTALTAAALRLATRTAAVIERDRASMVERDRAAAQDMADRLHRLLGEAMADVQHTIEGARRGDRLAPAAAVPPGAPADGDPLQVLEWEVARFVSGVSGAVVDASTRSTTTALLTIGRRMMPLISQMLLDFTRCYSLTEDPDLLTQLFQLDHTATRLRRLAESVALVGGAAPRREPHPTKLLDVLNHAISEVERYERVRIASPTEGYVRGDVAPSLVHLLTELIDNATAYSPPSTLVEVRVDPEPLGAAITVDDRGLLIPAGKRRTLNLLLEDPAPYAAEVLADGRIGLWAVAEQARRFGIKVQLRSNVLLSNQAVIFVPKELFAPQPDAAARDRNTEELPAVAGGTLRPSSAAPTAAPQADGPRPKFAAPAQQPEPAADPLPVRQSGHRYMAAELAQPAPTRPTAASPVAPLAGLVAQVTSGRRRAEDAAEPDRPPAEDAADQPTQT